MATSGTDLFGQYYNNPTKSYIYANLLCTSGPSADEISLVFGYLDPKIPRNH